MEDFTLKKYEIHPIKKNLFIFLLLVLFLIIPISIFANLMTLIFSAVAIVLLFFYFLIHSIIEKNSFRLTFTENYVSIGKVFINKININLPYEKIQNVTILRGPLDRLLNMAGIIIETGEGLVLVRRGKGELPIILNKISNLHYRDAIEIKEFLLRKAGIKNLDTKSLKEEFPLEKRRILKESIKKTILGFIVLSFIAFYMEKILYAPLLIYIPIFFIFFLFVLFYEFLYFKNYHYSDNEEILCLRKGVFTMTEVTIPYKKVQNIFVDQDLLDRIFKLYDVHLSTIGRMSQIELHIDGVSKETAEKLKSFLLKRIKV
ncbi:MAG: PH domain-containing protein [Nanopusillaceae archaeon]